MQPSLLGRARAALFRAANPRLRRFRCPLCAYEGPFAAVETSPAFPAHARCPQCSALERHTAAEQRFHTESGGADRFDKAGYLRVYA